jgi:hypothetical protein
MDRSPCASAFANRNAEDSFTEIGGGFNPRTNPPTRILKNEVRGEAALNLPRLHAVILSNQKLGVILSEAFSAEPKDLLLPFASRQNAHPVFEK